MATDTRTTEARCAVAARAITEAAETMPKYAHPFLAKEFTERQLFAIGVLRRYVKTDFQGIIDILAGSPDLRGVLGLDAIPDQATLFQAEQRLIRKGFLPPM